jgi:hypothetical protein
MKISLFLAFFICSTFIFGQEKEKSSFKFDNKNSVQLDLGGHGMFYSLNYERIIFNGERFKTAAQVGCSFYPPSWGYIELWMPVGINEIFTLKNNHHIELGVGVVPTRSPSPEMEMYDSYSPWSSFLSARLGYRYQKPDGKFLFRAGFTPLLEGHLGNLGRSISSGLHPLLGVSFGYSF